MKVWQIFERNELGIRVIFSCLDEITAQWAWDEYQRYHMPIGVTAALHGNPVAAGFNTDMSLEFTFPPR